MAPIQAMAHPRYLVVELYPPRSPGDPINSPASMQGSNDGITPPTNTLPLMNSCGGNNDYPANWQSAGGGGYEGGAHHLYAGSCRGTS